MEARVYFSDKNTRMLPLVPEEKTQSLGYWHKKEHLILGFRGSSMGYRIFVILFSGLILKLT